MKKGLTILLSIGFHYLQAQVSVKDSSIYTPMLGFSYGYQFPGGDMVKRFGNSSSVGMNLDFKSQSYFLIGVNGSYFFGHTVKEDIFKNIETPDGGIINRDGQYADIRTYERGFTASGTIGRLFPIKKKPNPNCGLMVNLGFGFLQHKIRIETIGNNVPQLNTQYKKGYDRMTSGFLMTQNLSYLYLSNNRLVNFVFGFECLEGFTKSRRNYQFDLMAKDTSNRLDILYGARVAWILPLYRKPPSEFYTH